MKSLTRHRGQTGPAINHVCDQRVAQSSHVNADLMGSPRMQNASDEASMFTIVQQNKVRLRRFSWMPPKINHRHAQAISRVPANRGVNRAQ